MTEQLQEPEVQNEELQTLEEEQEVEEIDNLDQNVEPQYNQEEEEFQNNQEEEELQYNQEEEGDTQNQNGDFAETLSDRHKITLNRYSQGKTPDDLNEINNYYQNVCKANKRDIYPEPPEIYDSLVIRYGPGLLSNTSRIDELKGKRESRNDYSKPEKMTNDQLRESIAELALAVTNLNEEIDILKDSINTLEQQYVVYQQKKKEREMAQLSAHAKKSSKSPKGKTSAAPSPRQQTPKK